MRGMRLQDRGIDTVYILTMTDYDPAGYYIAEALETQVNDILSSMDMSHIGVEIVRVGITPDQLSEDLVEANKYTPKPANIEKWFERTGGIDGEPKGLELDALEPRQIREIFVETIEQYIDVEQYKDFIKKSYIKKKALAAMAEKVQGILDLLVDDFEAEIELRAFDIIDLAKRGNSSIPVERLCEDTMDEQIEARALSYFTI